MGLGFALRCMAVLLGTAAVALGQTPTYVIHISVDGAGSSYVQSQMNLGFLPNFQRFQTQGAFTNNARTDYNYTITLPNHTSMITGLPVNNVGSVQGHNWITNVDPAIGQTLHNNRGSYVPSVFDVVHDNGLRTAMYAGKTKFSIYDTSYNATYGALDTTGVNNGRDKIDTYVVNTTSSTTLTNSFITSMTANPYHYTFLHYADPDNEGHDNGWGTTQYNTALRNVDARIGDVFNMIDNTPALTGRTMIILTADHGGTGTGHSTSSQALNYTIPLYVWGPGVAAGEDLYELNSTSRTDPLTGRPDYLAAGQPIRSGDSANLALDALGLGSVPGSTINFSQNLMVVPEPAGLCAIAAAGMALCWRRRKNRMRVGV